MSQDCTLITFGATGNLALMPCPLQCLIGLVQSFHHCNGLRQSHNNRIFLRRSCTRCPQLPHNNAGIRRTRVH